VAEIYDPLPALIDFSGRTRFANLSSDVVHETKRRIIDGIGCALGALDDERLRERHAFLTRRAVSYDGAGLAIGGPDPIALVDAAFLNSTMIRWLDYNDTYLAKEPSHPSDNIGVLLALAGSRRLSGADLIAATAIAYDAQCRLCEAASLRSHGFDHTNYILISSALGVGRMLGLGAEAMYDIVAFALNSHVALRQAREGSYLSEQKNMAAGDAVRAVAWSLEKVMAGSHGPAEIVTGKHGLVQQLSGPLDPTAFDGLGEHYYITNTYIKKYPVEYHGQTIVEHALAAREALSLDGKADALKAIDVQGYEAQTTIIADATKRRPGTKETADHSLFYVFAAPLIEGEMTFEQYRPELLNDC
jgi:2-methylcitrate dehydratase